LAGYLRGTSATTKDEGMTMRPYSKQESDEIIHIAQENVEQFRHDAYLADRSYSRAERRLLQGIETKYQAAFYTRCKELYQPTTKSLQQKRPFEAMRAQMQKSLLIGKNQADNLTTDLYQMRQETLRRETVALLPRRAQKHARRILTLPPDQLEQLLEHYQQATLYREVATSLRVVTYDPHRSFISRLVRRYRIYRHRIRTLRKEKQRIKVIDRLLTKLDLETDNFLQRILSSEVELMEVLALRHEFEKKTKGQPSTPRRTLDRFEAMTKKFINKQLESYQAQCPDATLNDIGQRKNTLTQLLQDIFALRNTDRNWLVRRISEYTKLYDEKQSIVTAQCARQAYIDS